MITLCTDLDNTLIYSYKYEIGVHKVCAEVYEGREVSFMTEKTRELLHKVSEKVMLVPVTTRTVEQYRRIDLGIGEIPCALVCNGGVLLVNGREDNAWYEESLERIGDSVHELEKAAGILEKDTGRCLEVRNVKGLFLFTKSNAPAETAKRLRQALDSSRVDVFSQGGKGLCDAEGIDQGECGYEMEGQDGSGNKYSGHERKEYGNCCRGQRIGCFHAAVCRCGNCAGSAGGGEGGRGDCEGGGGSAVFGRDACMGGGQNVNSSNMK